MTLLVPMNDRIVELEIGFWERFQFIETPWTGRGQWAISATRRRSLGWTMPSRRHLASRRRKRRGAAA